MRVAVLVVIGLLELAAFGASISSYDVQLGAFGFVVGRDVTVVEVEPGLPAAAAQIAPGDRIAYETLSLVGRRALIFSEEIPAGTTLSFTIVHRGTRRAVSLRAVAVSHAFSQIETIAYALAGFALGIVSLTLVGLRPSRMTWAFAAIAPPLLVPWSAEFWAQNASGVAPVLFDAFVSLLYGAQGAGILIFASRFPTDRPRGFTRIVDLLGVPAGILVSALLIYGYIAVRVSPAPPAHFATIAEYAVIVPSIAALICLIATYATTKGGARSRLAPTIGSFAIFIVAIALEQIGSEMTSDPAFVLATALLYALAPALVAASVAYGVVRHRVIDVNFIIGRTLVYTALTVFVVAVFTLIEYLVGKLLEERRLAQIMEVAAAVGIGVSLNYVHGWLDRVLDVVFFRRRHAAEERLAAAARTLPHVETNDLVAGILIDEPCDALELASAAVFRFDGTRYVRQGARAWDGCAAELERDDWLVVRLRSELMPTSVSELRWRRTDVPQGEFQPIFAVPIASGHELEGIALYGAHAHGEDLDPDERRSLTALAAAAALAYDTIARQQLRRQLDELGSENRMLREMESRLTALLEDRLRGASGEGA